MSLLGRNSPSIRPITGRPSLAPSSFPRCPIGLPCGSLSRSQGGQRGYFVHLVDRRGLGRASRPVALHPRQRSVEASVPGHIPFWFRPVSIFGLSNITAFNSTSPGLTLPRTACPQPPDDAGSRRVGSRFHDRSCDRGYVVPQASYQPVARKARCGSRPMAEHRVTSVHLLDASRHRSIKCDESHQHLVRRDATTETSPTVPTPRPG
jgi:hypothetical protein